MHFDRPEWTPCGVGPLMHGFKYMRMYYLLGFENFMMNLASDDPRIHTLLAIVRDYNRAVVGKCIEAEAEYLTFGDDLGCSGRCR